MTIRVVDADRNVYVFVFLLDTGFGFAGGKGWYEMFVEVSANMNALCCCGLHGQVG